MDFDSYLRTLKSKNLSDVKLLILKTLWGNGTSFPRDWVSSSLLLKLTNQKYFDRRTRELRDELGCDIETRQINGEHHYRLNSTDLGNANPRYYLSESEKKQLFSRAKSSCAICGKETGAGVRGLQADHKIPLIRGGSNDLNNWQAVCNECNVAKRRACQGCIESCNTCSWAFPIEFGISVSIRLPLAQFKKLEGTTHDVPQWIAQLIEREIGS
jgi:5-methylcytosine-specific restriction endonuclease McrA